MKTVYVHFSNHFDLVWRRCWERAYRYQDGQYASYRRVEELCLLRNLELAENDNGAYVVEQTLTMRAFLETHPDALARLQRLYAQGLFEMCGAGEAIIDVNMCAFETMCRNLASGVRYCHDVLGMPPLLANHGDGFGSSAQFPQVIRQCGFPGINGLSYSQPDNLYWRGLDGSTVLVWKGAPGHGYFYDHCYHEPCRACGGTGCPACGGTGFDMPQNFYPPFTPVPPEKLTGEVAQYNVCSEEMLPPENFSAHLRQWEKDNPGVRYVWGTPRQFQPLWASLAAAVDHAPADTLASRVENNPVQTGCYVSRIRVKQLARQAEETFYGWETAVALSRPQALDRRAWEQLFLELPLFFFHDAVTGTHQDEAYAELLDRMQAMPRTTVRLGCQALGSAAIPAGAGGDVAVFSPNLATAALRVPLPETINGPVQRVAVTAAGQRFPVVPAWHADCPAVPLPQGRMIVPVGPTARTRPAAAPCFLEAAGLEPLAWTQLRLEPACPPRALPDRELRNPQLTVALGEHGVTTIRELSTGATVRADTDFQLGELLLEEDEGDPWGTRKKSAFRHGLAPFTRFLGATQFDGYQEAYYCGVYEPNLRFGREADPAVFALEWYTTVRLLGQARRVDFSHEVFWKTANRRLRVVFPVQAAVDTAWYSIPGGWLERPRYEQTETALWSPNGDWPALHFVAARPTADSATGWAAVNYGTPSCRVEDGRILVSLLRSPGFGHCLERYGQDYPMPTSGIRDPGWHHFTFSLLPHTGASDMPRLALQAGALNKRPTALPCAPDTRLPDVPFRIAGDGIELVAAKTPFGTDLPAGTRVLRLLNLRSADTVAVLTPRPGALGRAGVSLLTETGLVEISPDASTGWRLAFRPFEVKTVMLFPV